MITPRFIQIAVAGGGGYLPHIAGLTMDGDVYYWSSVMVPNVENGGYKEAPGWRLLQNPPDAEVP